VTSQRFKTGFGRLLVLDAIQPVRLGRFSAILS